VTREETVVAGEVVEVDYDRDTITVRLEDGAERTFPFQLFDEQDVYQAGQRFRLTQDDGGEPRAVSLVEAASARAAISGYVESVDQDDELVWVYLRGEEGWQRKVMPLRLFEEHDLARPGSHFLLELGEDGTPTDLQPDEHELEMLPQAVEETKPRWTNRPAAEAD